MTRILFAWELGANLGHLTRDLPLARACRDAGLEVIFAVPNLRAAADSPVTAAAAGVPERVAPLRQRADAGEQKAKLNREFGASRVTLHQYLRTDQ